MTDLFLAAFVLIVASAGIVIWQWRSSRTDKHLDKLGPRAIENELRRQREERK